MSNVNGIIKSIQDIMRKEVGVDGDAQRISQLVWMFFLKIYDDREAELELLEDDYHSPLPEARRPRHNPGIVYPAPLPRPFLLVPQNAASAPRSPHVHWMESPSSRSGRPL